MNAANAVRVAGCLAALAMMAGCARGPTISAQQESSQYLSRAGRNYTPPGPPSDPWGPYITEAAQKFDVPERWIREVMRQESGGRLYGRNGDLVTSGAGAMGLMQVMPGTYDEIRARYPELGSDPYDPHNNILAGTAYIREMYDIYGSPGFLAAYNAGPGRLDDYLTRNRTLPEETRRYVASIGPKIAGTFPSTRSPGEQYAMNALPLEIPDGPRYRTADSRYGRGNALIPVTSQAPIVVPTPAAPPVVVAQASESPAPYIRLSPQPAVVAPEPEPARGPFITLQPVRVAEAEPPRALPVFAPMPVPPPAPAPVAAAPRFVPQLARLPEPPPPAPRQMVASAVPQRGTSFAFFTPAHAEPVAMRHGGAANWAVQVGAFSNQGQAAAATTAARDHARDVLGTARTTVASVRQPGGVLYRARLTGLTRDGAAAACERLARSRTTCLMVSPDAQS